MQKHLALQHAFRCRHTPMVHGIIRTWVLYIVVQVALSMELGPSGARSLQLKPGCLVGIYCIGPGFLKHVYASSGLVM